jgi:hypothetical protein
VAILLAIEKGKRRMEGHEDMAEEEKEEGGLRIEDILAIQR